MTVREAFSKAFGPVPDGATCHLGHDNGSARGHYAVIASADALGTTTTYKFASGRWVCPSLGVPVIVGPDIGERPAKSFLGFFGNAYDKAVTG